MAGGCKDPPALGPLEVLGTEAAAAARSESSLAAPLRGFSAALGATDAPTARFLFGADVEWVGALAAGPPAPSLPALALGLEDIVPFKCAPAQASEGGHMSDLMWQLAGKFGTSSLCHERADHQARYLGAFKRGG